MNGALERRADGELLQLQSDVHAILNRAITNVQNLINERVSLLLRTYLEERRSACAPPSAYEVNAVAEVISRRNSCSICQADETENRCTGCTAQARELSKAFVEARLRSRPGAKSPYWGESAVEEK